MTLTAQPAETDSVSARSIWIGEERSRSWGYRKSLDGLRAIAVFVVLGYHAGIDVFGAGFVGVDLFFVLSGFVVTNAILVEVERTGSVRLRRFYARRIRRLMPAAVTTIVGTCLLYLLVFPLLQRLEVVGDAQASLLYVANWYAISESNDYFAVAEDASPFLHFWSLAIEEQFYFLFPLLVLVLLAAQRWANHRRAALIVLPVLGLASLAAQLTLGGSDASRAYYGTDARLYQVLVGCTLAYALTNRSAVRIRRWIPALGSFLALAAFGVIATPQIDVSVSHRGVVAAAVAGLLVLALELDVQGPLPRLLARPTILYLGSISYGIYLWHWPVILTVREVTDLGPWPLAIVGAVIACALASLSYHVLEDPIRRSAALTNHPRLVIGVGLAVPLVAAITVVPSALQSSAQPRVARPAPTLEISGPAGDPSSLAAPVPPIDFASVRNARVQSPRCVPGDVETCSIRVGGGPTVVLIGDSHAQMYLPAIEEIAERNDWTLSANVVAGCPWQTGLVPRSDQTPERRETCAALRSPWYRGDLPRLDPDIIILVTRSWDDDELGDVIRPADAALVDAPLDEVHRTTSARTVDTLAAATDATIVVIEPTPLADFDPLTCLSGATTVGECAFASAAAPTAEDAALRDIDLSDEQVTSIDFDLIVCPTEPVCVPVIDDTPVWRDSHHLTIDFVRRRARTFEAKLYESGAFDDVPTMVDG